MLTPLLAITSAFYPDVTGVPSLNTDLVTPHLRLLHLQQVRLRNHCRRQEKGMTALAVNFSVRFRIQSRGLFSVVSQVVRLDLRLQIIFHLKHAKLIPHLHHRRVIQWMDTFHPQYLQRPQ